jgi:hypothetical protein
MQKRAGARRPAVVVTLAVVLGAVSLPVARALAAGARVWRLCSAVVVLVVVVALASPLTGPATGAGSGEGCPGAKLAGRVSAVAPTAAAETPAG